MRKIKITALLLAVLMIVTAFAGCASKSTVTNLDNKVNDLDASIEEQKAALSGIESTLATISKALENQGSSDNLDEVIKDIEENEKATADLADAIKDLQSAIEDLKKEPATQAPATPDDLQVVINQYSAKLEALAGEVEDDKANYTAETLTAIRELVGEVETSIENAKDKAAVEAAYKHNGPVYLRFGRLAVPVFHDEENYKFQIGKGEILRDGTDVAIIANGLMVYEAIQAGEALAQQGIQAMVINMATIKPLDEELVLNAARKCRKIITCEEHSVIGGLGEAVCGVLSRKCPTWIECIGINDEFGHSGPANQLLKKFGLTAEHITEVALQMCDAASQLTS